MEERILTLFAESVLGMSKTMLGCEARQLDAPPTPGAEDSGYTAIIGLCGKVRGSVALSLPNQTANRMISRLLGMESAWTDDEIRDGASELVNIIAGSAKGGLRYALDAVISLGLPNVVHGTNYFIRRPANVNSAQLPFESELGRFSVWVCLEVEAKPR